MHCLYVVSHDNGTTFIGANNKLKRCLRELRDDAELHSPLNLEGTAWKFIPPSAPHFGGLWEAGVKSVKYHLRRMIGKRKFTFEEFYTFLTRIEANLLIRTSRVFMNA